MIRSKAAAALMRLKEMDKKYRARYEDERQEQSSDNTENLLEQAEYKNHTLPSLPSEKQEILKPTLNIKIPDTYVEQLESRSTSDKASLSLRVSVVDKTPAATPRVASQSVSEIHEELDEAESIDEAIEESDRSEDTSNSNKGHKNAEGKSASLAVTVQSVSIEQKQSNNYEGVSTDTHSIGYSSDSFDSSAHSRKKDSASIIISSKSEISEGQHGTSVLNTGEAQVLSEIESIRDVKKLAEGIEKTNKIVTAEDTEAVDELNEIIEELSVSDKAADSSYSKLGENAKFEGKKVASASESVADASHGKLNSNKSNRKKSGTNERESQEISSSIKDENSFNSKSRGNSSKRKDSETTQRSRNERELSSSLKATNSSGQKSEAKRNLSSARTIADKLESKEEFRSEESSRSKSGKQSRNRRNSEIINQENSEASSSSFVDVNTSSGKSGKVPVETKDSGPPGDNESNEGSSTSAKASSSLPERFRGNKTAAAVPANTIKQVSSESLRGSREHRRKSSDRTGGFGAVPKSDAVESKSSSRRISARGRGDCGASVLERKVAEKGFPKTIDGAVRRSQSAVEIGATRARKNSAVIKRKKRYHNSKLHEDVKGNKNDARISKSSTFHRVREEERRERKDPELERLKTRMSLLRLEQERQSMLRCLRDFEEERDELLAWPDRLYCPGKPEVSVIEPLNFPNVLNFVKPGPTAAEGDSTVPDNHLTVMKNRVAEIRQWLRDQFILYRDYSDVASAINAKYVAEAQKNNPLPPESAPQPTKRGSSTGS